MKRVLIDECLSPTLAAHANARGYDATHVRFLGRSGMQDYALVDVILDAALDFVATLDHTMNRLIEVHSSADIRLSNLPPGGA